MLSDGLRWCFPSVSPSDSGMPGKSNANFGRDFVLGEGEFGEFGDFGDVASMPLRSLSGWPVLTRSCPALPGALAEDLRIGILASMNCRELSAVSEAFDSTAADFVASSLSAIPSLSVAEWLAETCSTCSLGMKLFSLAGSGLDSSEAVRGVRGADGSTKSISCTPGTPFLADLSSRPAESTL